MADPPLQPAGGHARKDAPRKERMGTSPEHDGRPLSGKASSLRASGSGVRTEYDLRIQLRQALERNATLERAMRESVAYAYGRRDLSDLRKLRAVLSAAGFRDEATGRVPEPEDAKEPHS